MEPLGLILVAVALGTDAFSLATGLALGGFRGRQAWLFAGTVGLFHIFMPLAGLYLGLLLGRLLGKVAAIIGALVLATMGTLMLWEAYNNRRQGGSMVGQVLRVIPGRGGRPRRGHGHPLHGRQRQPGCLKRWLWPGGH